MPFFRDGVSVVGNADLLLDPPIRRHGLVVLLFRPRCESKSQDERYLVADNVNIRTNT